MIPNHGGVSAYSFHFLLLGIVKYKCHVFGNLNSIYNSSQCSGHFLDLHSVLTFKCLISVFSFELSILSNSTFIKYECHMFWNLTAIYVIILVILITATSLLMRNDQFLVLNSAITWLFMHCAFMLAFANFFILKWQ